jgi:hypothetical protein
VPPAADRSHVDRVSARPALTPSAAASALRICACCLSLYVRDRTRLSAVLPPRRVRCDYVQGGGTVTVYARRDYTPETRRTRLFALRSGAQTQGIRLPHDFGTHIFQFVFSEEGEEDLTLETSLDTSRVHGHTGSRTTILGSRAE